MVRFLIFLAIVYAGYRVFKSWVTKHLSSGQAFPGKSSEINDEMVKDPFCQAYFPRRNGVPLEIGGKQMLFCSNECRDRFLVYRENPPDSFPKEP